MFKALCTKRAKKGFTLAELLIVVAIIGVLVAIAIPTFSASLLKAKEAADMANVRAWYADCVVTDMTEQTGFASAAYGKDGAGNALSNTYPDLNYSTKLVVTPSATSMTVVYTPASGTALSLTANAQV